jgi:hypothetical protein
LTTCRGGNPYPWKSLTRQRPVREETPDALETCDDARTDIRLAFGVPTGIPLTEDHFAETVDLMNSTEKEKFTPKFSEAVAPDMGKRADEDILGR